MAQSQSSREGDQLYAGLELVQLGILEDDAAFDILIVLSNVKFLRFSQKFKIDSRIIPNYPRFLKVPIDVKDRSQIFDKDLMFFQDFAKIHAEIRGRF